jgi:hypothetical protein
VINFRYHLVSIIAVFLALGIGIIMGTAVIDRAVVDRLERQQDGLRRDIDDVRSENNKLRSELSEERDASRKLADEGSQRLLDGALLGTPVLVVGLRGVEADGLDDLLTLLARAEANYRGTIWFTDRFRLDNDDSRRDLAAALGMRPDAGVGALRAEATVRVSDALRPLASAASDEAASVLPALREAGFVDYDAPEGVPADSFAPLASGTRIVVMSGVDAPVPDRQLMVPFTRALVEARLDRSPAPVLAISSAPPESTEDDTFIGPLRQDPAIADQLSTVDDIDDFAGRLASVLAIADLGAARFGHYGRGSGAQRLLPAPAE